MEKNMRTHLEDSLKLKKEILFYLTVAGREPVVALYEGHDGSILRYKIGHNILKVEWSSVMDVEVLSPEEVVGMLGV